MQKLNLLIISIFSIFLFTGCGSKNVEVKIPESQIMADKEKSYIIFTRPYNIMGGGPSSKIIEFDEKSSEPIALAASINNGEKTIYKINEGTHYFYTTTGVHENILKISLKRGEVKYVSLGVNINLITGFYPMVFEQNRLDLLNEISNLNCDKKNIDKLLLTEIEENNFISPLKFNIKCKNREISSIEDTYYNYTLENLRNSQLVSTSESYEKEYLNNKNQYKKDLSRIYSIWDIKLQDIPIVESPVMQIEKIIEDKYLNGFESINIVNGSHNENANKTLINEFILELNDKFKNINNNGKELTIKITFDKYDNGSMLKRYTIAGILDDFRNSLGVIDLKVDLINDNNETFNSFRIFEVEAGGILGGINTLKSDTLNIIEKYITNNLLVENK